MLHTIDERYPIYDKKVMKYLSKNENVVLWFNKKSPNILEYIEHDCKELINRYKRFLKGDESKTWINWFDKEFPSFIKISQIKKIDFIIYACL